MDELKLEDGTIIPFLDYHKDLYLNKLTTIVGHKTNIILDNILHILLVPYIFKFSFDDPWIEYEKRLIDIFLFQKSRIKLLKKRTIYCDIISKFTNVDILNIIINYIITESIDVVIIFDNIHDVGRILRNNDINNLFVNHRHYNTSIIILEQSILYQFPCVYNNVCNLILTDKISALKYFTSNKFSTLESGNYILYVNSIFHDYRPRDDNQPNRKLIFQLDLPPGSLSNISYILE